MSPRRVAWILAAACLLPHAIKLAYYPGYPGFDDAFIHLRVAELFSGGKGWGINAFEPVNLSSSPLFTLMLAAAHRLGAPGLPSGMLLSAIASSAAIATAFFLTQGTVSHSGLALAAPLVFAVNLHLWRWNATAMEPTLACVLLGASLLTFAWSRRGQPARFVVLGGIIGIGFLSRFELGLLLPATALALLCSAVPSDRDTAVFSRRTLFTLLGFLPIAGLWLAFCWHTFGTLLPTTYLSKASSLSFTNAATLRSIVIVLGMSAGIPALLAALALRPAVSRGGLAVLRTLHQPYLAAIWFTLLSSAFYAVSVPSLQSPGRYLLPTAYALTIAVAGVTVGAVDRFGITQARARLGAGLAMIQVVGMLAVHHIAVAPILAGFRDNYWRASRQAAAYLVETVELGDTVFAVSDIGMLAYYSHDRYRVVDAPGLAAPELVGLDPRAALARSRPRLVVEHYGDTDVQRLALSPDIPYLRVRSFPFDAPGLVSARGRFALNVYRASGQ